MNGEPFPRAVSDEPEPYVDEESTIPTTAILVPTPERHPQQQRYSFFVTTALEEIEQERGVDHDTSPSTVSMRNRARRAVLSNKRHQYQQQQQEAAATPISKERKDALIVPPPEIQNVSVEVSKATAPTPRTAEAATVLTPRIASAPTPKIHNEAMSTSTSNDHRIALCSEEKREFLLQDDTNSFPLSIQPNQHERDEEALKAWKKKVDEAIDSLQEGKKRIKEERSQGSGSYYENYTQSRSHSDDDDDDDAYSDDNDGLQRDACEACVIL